MVELLGVLIGLAGRLVPEVIGYFDRKDARAHELAMLDKQIEADRLRATLEMQKMELAGEIQQAIEELKALTAASTQPPASIARTGNRFADVMLAFFEALSASVRPIVTYWYVLVGYGTYKGALLYLAIGQGVSFMAAVAGLWTDFDSATVASVLSFWFLDRTLRKMGRQ